MFVHIMYSMCLYYKEDTQIQNTHTKKEINKYLSSDLDGIIPKWNTIFQGDALSLVAKPNRSLIARWVKRALMIHQLRKKVSKNIQLWV